MSILSHPLTKHLELDDPELTVLRRRIVREKSFLRQIYLEWYEFIAASLPESNGPVLELGAGAGFMGDIVSDLIRSEIFYSKGIDIVADGQCLPFRRNALRGIVMTDVLHHLPDVHLFFSEASRCLLQGGVVCMVEPWVSPWSRLVYDKLHHEPFEPERVPWSFPASGPVSGANGALPWIVFERDREIFEQKFPNLQIVSIKPTMPFRYLLSGGVSMRSLVPGCSFRLCKVLENSLQSWIDTWAMFAMIVLVKK